MPHAKDEKEAEEAYKWIKTFVSSNVSKPSERRIFRITYTHCGQEYVAEVGQQEPRIGKVTLAIFEGNPFIICTPCHGAGEGLPILIQREDIVSVEAFS
jgi:hypothetical protein